MKQLKAVPLLIVFLFLASLFIYIPRSEASATYIWTDINTSITWTAAGSPYIILKEVKVGPSATLTIGAGVVVKFHNPVVGNRGKLTISGQIIAKGSPGQEIVFERNNTIGAPKWDAMDVSGTASSFDHCRFKDANNAINAISLSGFKITNSTFENVTGPLRFTSTSSGLLYNLTYTLKDIGYNLNGSSRIDVINCVGGMYLKSSDNITIRGLGANQGGNKAVSPMRMENCASVLLENCTLTNSLGNCIEAMKSRNLAVTRCNLSTCKVGVYLSDTQDVQITFTNISQMTDNGIYLAGASHDNEFSNCSLSFCKRAAFFEAASYENWIFHNNFIKTQDLPKDDGANHWWSVELEGNYWDDYGGVDDGSGGRPMGDLIGDTVLPAQGVDQHPYVKAWGWMRPVMVGILDPAYGYNLDPDGVYYVNCSAGKRTENYRLQESKSFSGGASIQEFTSVSPPNQFFSGKNEGKLEYRVRGENSKYMGDWSPIATVEVNFPPAKVIGLKVASLPDGGGLNISWKANTEPDLEGYRIYSNLTGSWALIGQTPASQAWLLHLPLTNNRTYWYRVAAYDNKSQFSQPTEAWGIPLNTNPPGPVIGLCAQTKDTDTIELHWTTPSDPDLDHYVIFRGLEPDYSKLIPFATDVPDDNVSYWNSGLADYTEYSYCMVTYDTAGNPSNPSAIVSNRTYMGQRPPQMQGQPSILNITEDLTDQSLDLGKIFTDPNGDTLWFGYAASGSNISIRIKQGIVSLSPKKDWVGVEQMSFYATDNITPPTFFLVEVVVKNVNDPPSGLIIEPTNGAIFKDTDNITLEGLAWDADTPYDENERVVFSWYSNVSKYIGKGNRTVVKLPAGTHEITLKVEDNYGDSGNATITIIVEKTAVPADDDADDDVIPSDDDVHDDDMDDDVADDDTDDDTIDTSGYFGLVVIILIVLIVLAMAIFAFVFMRSRNRKKDVSEPEDEAQSIEPEIESKDIFVEKTRSEAIKGAGRSARPTPKAEGAPKIIHGTKPRPPAPRPRVEVQEEVETWVTDGPVGLSPAMAPPAKTPIPQKGPEKKEELDPYTDAVLPKASIGDSVGTKKPVLALPPAIFLDWSEEGLDVDEVFVVSSVSGLLINHYTANRENHMDEDILTSMLSAVQSFISDSFKGRDSALKQLRMGDFTIILEKGKYVTVVLFTSQKDVAGLTAPTKELIRDIEGNYKDILKDWDGNVHKLSGIQELVQGFLSGEYGMGNN